MVSPSAAHVVSMRQLSLARLVLVFGLSQVRLQKGEEFLRQADVAMGILAKARQGELT